MGICDQDNEHEEDERRKNWLATWLYNSIAACMSRRC
jgi:hypothetical protein